MKKIMILGVALLVLLMGCGQEKKTDYKSMKEEKMVCKRTANMNGMEMDFHYEVYYQGNNVNKVQTTEKITSSSAETLKNLESQIKALYSNFDNIENYKYQIIIDGDTLISTTDINYQKIDIDELLKIDSSIQQLLNDNKKIALDKITQVYEQTGATCNK